ncbi:nitroreductase family protein [candidate division KSB1 bacterium]|nr:nitroreductase family protein [candidate division KSB1 bacterium]RQW08051.1 MAG: nitroreductase family protein [candidate division KSB1 bacterium]
MDIRTAIENRRSIRKFKPDPIPLTDIKELVRRASLAPSVNNSQPWHFIVVTKKEKIADIAQMVHKKVHAVFEGDKTNVTKTVDYFSTIFEKAPVVIFIAAEPYEAIADELIPHDRIDEMRQRPNIQSLGAAVENLLLSAVEMGYGACWLSGLMVARAELEQTLGIEAPFELMTAVALGLPDGEPGRRKKKDLAEIFTLID